jgi:RNA polymerase sigma factor (TIGR02999 family)
MNLAVNEELTALLRAWGQGDAAAGERLLPLVYDELRRLAASYLRKERPDHTLRPTALVHEAYLRLVGQQGGWQNRQQFFGVAAQMMRRVLVDHARSRRRLKRAGGWTRVSLDAADGQALYVTPDVDLLALEEALGELQGVDPEAIRLVELRFFAGLSIEDAAQVMGVSVATANRSWRLAKAWLFQRLEGAPARD